MNARAQTTDARTPPDSAPAPILAGVTAKAGEIASLAILVAVLPRILGPADYGIFALGLTIVTLGSAALSLGASAMLTRFLPAEPEGSRAPLARALAERLARRRLGQIAVIAVVAAVLTLAAPGTFPTLPTALIASALALDLAASLCFQLALGLGRDKLWSFRYPLQNTFLAGAAILLGSLAGATGALVALLVATALAFVAGAAAVAGSLRGPTPAEPVPSAYLRFGRLQGLSNLLFLVAHRGGVLLAALMLGAREIGFTGLAVGVALAVLYSAWQIAMLQLATLSRYAATDLAHAERQASRLAAQMLVVLVPFALVAGVVLEPLLVAVFGEDFRGATSAFIPVLALVPLVPATALANQAAARRVRPEARLWASAAGLAVFAVTAPPCIAEWGAPGATAALLASTAAVVLVSVRVLPRFASRQLLLASASSSTVALVIPLAW